ncbi:hypothetical protein [Sphingomonas sp.]|uniref:hypothetical protein n=1 Tax=Sphingomonas sp. TaxID=28214 RepID=UPI0031DFED4C
MNDFGGARRLFVRLAVLAISAPAGAAAPAPVNLSTPLGITPGWQLLATQGPDVEDPGGNKAPGALHLCITRDGGKTCRPALDDLLARGGGHDVFDTAHYLQVVRIIHPARDRPLLWVQVASLYSGNGDQVVGRTALAYDKAGDRFTAVYAKRTGHNNNQEVRYLDKGPLHGAIISAEPTSDAPFGFWITVDRLARDGRYAPVLRYRSGTHYGDGNPLAVIDSEMPEILRRLKLWRSGAPLPLPDGPCPKPHLVHGVLWCKPPAGAGN